MSDARSSSRELMLEPIVPPDSHHLLAAQGWLELGSHVEASEELQKLTPRLRAHPYALELSWQTYAAAKKWDAALDIASTLTQLLPEHPFGWIHRSYCLHELKRTQEARDDLLPMVWTIFGMILFWRVAKHCARGQRM